MALTRISAKQFISSRSKIKVVKLYSQYMEIIITIFLNKIMKFHTEIQGVLKWTAIKVSLPKEKCVNSGISLPRFLVLVSNIDKRHGQKNPRNSKPQNNFFFAFLQLNKMNVKNFIPSLYLSLSILNVSHS